MPILTDNRNFLCRTCAYRGETTVARHCRIQRKVSERSYFYCNAKHKPVDHVENCVYYTKLK